MKLRYLVMLALGVSAAGCGDDAVKTDYPVNSCKQAVTENCVEIPGGDSAALVALVNELKPNTTIILGEGRFMFNNEVSINDVAGISLIGQGIDRTTLDFGPMTAQGNGIYAGSTDKILVQDFTVIDSVKDGIKIENAKGVTFRRIRVTWTNESDPTNGPYGIYPVKVQDVLVEDSIAENASDAGLYVGQCQRAIVRNNVVRGNVAGLEIENTQFADVYGNLAEDNTGGIVVFDMPGNPIFGRDVRVRDNIIRNNNRANFAPGGFVKAIPAGTGTFAMASRRVEFVNNTYENNKTLDIGVIDGRVVDANVEGWSVERSKIIGNNDGMSYPNGYRMVEGVLTEDPTLALNAASWHIVVSGNTHSGSGTNPDVDVELGLALKVVFGTSPVANVIYDTFGETSFDPTDASATSNDNVVCVGGNTGGTFAASSLRADPLPVIMTFADNRSPFDCTALPDGPVADVVLSGN